MSDFVEIPIQDNFSIVLKTEENRLRNLSDVILQRVEDIWISECKVRGDHLFNGRTLNIVKVEQDHLVAEIIEYKYCLAQIRDSSLEKYLKVRQLAINGYTITQNYVLVGLRSQSVTQFPLCYELVPSGGVDANADLKQQLMKEFNEETNLDPSVIKEVCLKSIVYDEGLFTYEICAEMRLNCLPEELQPTSEYSKLIWLPIHQVDVFLEEYAHKMVPLTRYLLKNRGTKKGP